MKRIARGMQAITFGGIAVLLVWQMAAVPAKADAAYDRQQAIWADMQKMDRAAGFTTKVLQDLIGNDASKQILADYGDALMIISINKELMHSGDLQAAVKIIAGKLADMALEKIAPGFHKWFGWFGWAKAGLEIFKDFIFDPMIEQSQIDQYISLRKALNDSEFSYERLHGYPYLLERVAKEYKKHNAGALVFKADGSISEKWRADFDKFGAAMFEKKYEEKVHAETREQFRLAAADAEDRLNDIRARLIVFLEEYRVKAVVLTPSRVKLYPGEQQIFSAAAVFAGKGAERSAVDATGGAEWEGGTSDNVFRASASDVGKTFVIKATYAEIPGTATITVVEPDCGDDGYWNSDLSRCECDSGYWSVELEECVSEEPEPDDGEVREVLADLEHEFYGAVDAFDEYYDNFIALLNSHGAGSSEDICTDANIAYSFARAAVAYDLVSTNYFTALGLVDREDRGLNWDAIGAGNYESDIHVKDQIRLEMFRKDFQRVEGLGEGMPDQLAQFAPGCDPQDLLDLGSRTAEADQDPETGVDGPGGTVPPGGGGGGGGGGNEGELRYELAARFGESRPAVTCNGGQLNIELDAPEAVFPQTILPEGTYTVPVSFNWNAQGSDVVDVDVLLNVLAGGKKFEWGSEAFSGSPTVNVQFSGSDFDFAVGAASVTIVFGAVIGCGDDSFDGASIVLNQTYIRKGSP